MSTNGRRDGRGEADGFADPGEESSEGDKSELISIPPSLSFLLQGKKQLTTRGNLYVLHNNRGQASKQARQGGRGSNDNTGKDSPGGTFWSSLVHTPPPARNYFFFLGQASSASTRVNAARGKIGRTRCFEVFCCTQGRLGFLFWCVSLLFPMPAIFSAAKPPRRNISRCMSSRTPKPSLTKFLVQCYMSIQSSLQ